MGDPTALLKAVYTWSNLRSDIVWDLEQVSQMLGFSNLNAWIKIQGVSFYRRIPLEAKRQDNWAEGDKKYSVVTVTTSIFIVKGNLLCIS